MADLTLTQQLAVETEARNIHQLDHDSQLDVLRTLMRCIVQADKDIATLQENVWHAEQVIQELLCLLPDEVGDNHPRNFGSVRSTLR